MKMKRIDRISDLKTVLIALSAVTLYYCFSEAALRILSERTIGNDFEYFAAKAFSSEEWKMAEAFKNDLVGIGSRGVYKKGTIVYNYKPASSNTVNFNSSGFRGPQISEKENGEIRIAIFGCSRIWGNLEPDDRTIPAIVQRKLNEKFADRKISVINMGVEGYDLQRASEAAKVYHKEIQFDIAVFYFGYTDIMFSYINGIKNWEPFKDDNPMDDKAFSEFIGMTGFENIIERTNIYKMVKQSVRGEIFDKASEYGAENDSYFREIPEIQNKTAEMFPGFFVNRILQTAEYFKKADIHAFFVLPPVIQTKEPLSKLEKNVIANYELLFPGFSKYIVKCREGVLSQLKNVNEDLHFADHSDIFDGETATIFYDGMHMTPSGSKINAREIAGFLIDFLEKELLKTE